jgi:hypothetical protein
VCVAVHADEKEPLCFVDPTDRQFDTSDFLLKHKGALPVPSVITEPAVGYGMGLGRSFRPGDCRSCGEFYRRSAQPDPPNVAALGRFHTRGEDRYRLTFCSGVSVACAFAVAALFPVGSTQRGRAGRVHALLQQLLVRLGKKRSCADT